MKSKVLISLILACATISCTSYKEITDDFKGNWLNSSDSIQWVLSLQPEWAVYKNKFWEYDKISGHGKNLKVSLRDNDEEKELHIRLKGNHNILFLSDNSKECELTQFKATKPDFRSYEKSGFGNIVLVDDTAVISGFIEDYDSSIFLGSGKVIRYHVFYGFHKEESEINFNIDSSGFFMVPFRIFNPQQVFVTIDGSTIIRLFISPGDTVVIGFNKKLKAVTEDEKKWTKTSDWQINHFMGNNAMLSEEMTWLNYIFSDVYDKTVSAKFDNIDNMPQLEYIKWRKGLYDNESRIADSLLSLYHCSTMAGQWFNNFLDFELLSQLYRFQVNGSRFQHIGPLYTSQIPGIKEDSLLNLLNHEYTNYLNYLGFYDFVGSSGCALQAQKAVYLKHLLTIAKTEEDFNKIKKLAELTPIKPDDFSVSPDTVMKEFDYDRFLSNKASDLNAAYYEIMKVYSDMIPDSIMRSAFLSGLDAIIEKHNHNIHSELYAAFKLQSYFRYNSLGRQGKEWIGQNIADPVVKKVLLEKLESKVIEEVSQSEYSGNTVIINQIKSYNNPASFFDSIIGQFKGKVIYIDFWADWCSPCREAFKSAKRLKQLYAGKDVVFLYLGYNCKQDKWNKAIKNDQIGGYHYWLDKEQTAIMRERFGIVGIPHYLLIDKNGQLITHDVPGPVERASITSALDALLNKE